MWSNMWQVPTIEAPNQLDVSTVRRSLPIAVQQLRHIGRFQHTTTHRLISFHVHQATSHSSAQSKHWREASEVDELPMSNPQRRIVAMANGSQID
jgi:adenine-specific DNA glycosylase